MLLGSRISEPHRTPNEILSRNMSFSFRQMGTTPSVEQSVSFIRIKSARMTIRRFSFSRRHSRSTMLMMESSFPMLPAICRQNLSFPSSTTLLPSVNPDLLAKLKYSLLMASRSFHSSFSTWMNPFRKTVACLMSNRGMSPAEASNRSRKRLGIVYPFSFNRAAMDT